MIAVLLVTPAALANAADITTATFTTESDADTDSTAVTETIRLARPTTDAKPCPPTMRAFC